MHFWSMRGDTPSRRSGHAARVTDPIARTAPAFGLAVRSVPSSLVTLRRTFQTGTILVVAACGEPTGLPDLPHPSTIELSESALLFTSLAEVQSLTAVVRDSEGLEITNAEVVWTSTDPSVATISSSGAVTAVGMGQATMEATSGTASSLATATVEQTPATLNLSGLRVALSFLGDTTTFSAMVADMGGATIDDPEVLWATSDTGVARVNGSGLVTATGPGPVNLTATSGFAVDSIGIVVEQIPTTLTLSTDSLTLVAGDEIAVTASVLDEGGSEVENPTVTWLSADATIVAVANGLVLAISSGIAGVIAEVNSGSPGTLSAEVVIRVYERVSVATDALPPATTGKAYSASLTASGGDSTYVWTAGTPPPTGITLSLAGEISGTPSALGDSTFTVQVVSGDGQVATRELTLDVYAPLAVASDSLPPAVNGADYNESLTAEGGDADFNWSLESGSMPDGLALAGDGVISGVPTTTGSSSFTVQVTSGDGQVTSKQMDMDVYDPLSVTTGTLPAGSTGSAYSQPVAATGGFGPFTWVLSSGSLPSGVTLSGDGLISGTPMTAGSSTFTVQVTSSDGQVAAQLLAIDVYDLLSITTDTLPPARTGTGYSEALSASGGAAPFAWALTAGSPPTGISVSAGGTVSGVPTATGSSTFSVAVTSGDGQVATSQVTLDVYELLQVGTTFLPPANTGVQYDEPMAAVGGDGQYQWSVTVGALPQGLSLDPSSGSVTGAVTTPGTSVFTVEVTSGDGQVASRELTIVISDALSVTTASLPTTITGTPYNEMLMATGGDGNYTWSVISGSPPNGLTVSGNGSITGTSSSAVSASFTVAVLSGDGQSASRQLTISVYDPLQVTTTALLPAPINEPYFETLRAIGGDGSNEWTVSIGALPQGLSLDGSSGQITGTATVLGTADFTVELMSGDGQVDEQMLTLTVETCSLASPLDSDGDRLPDCVESGTNLYVDQLDTGTDAFDPDTDGDGISDGDEVLGTTLGLNLPLLGLNPLRKDILVEYDWFDDSLECGPHSHRTTSAIADMVTSTFATSPVVNPDGSSGVNFIHDYGQGGAFTGGNLIADVDGVLAGGVDGSDFRDYKSTNLAPERRGYFRYAILPHNYNTNSLSGGQAEVNGDDMILSLQCSAQVTGLGASVIVHELGHNLGLRHGGFENTNYKPNYNSVMNYKYSWPGIDANCTPPGDGVLSYSTGSRPDLNEMNLDETEGVCGNPPGPGWDWNGNGNASDVGIAFDINVDGNSIGDGVLGLLRDHNDWGALLFSGLSSGNGPVLFVEVITCMYTTLAAGGGE